IRYAAQRKHVEQASAALQISALRAEENARLERGLLPSPLLHTKDLEVVARYRPGRSQSLLGGDFYDVVETGDGTVHAVIGDVSGHGAAEAAIGVCLRVAWRSACSPACPGRPRSSTCPPGPAWSCSPTGCSRAGPGRAASGSARTACWISPGGWPRCRPRTSSTR